MRHEAYADAAMTSIDQVTARDSSAPQYSVLRAGGVALVSGAIVSTVFNVLFPRADDPFDTEAVLTMMVENETVRQVSFLGITLGIWVITLGAFAIYREIAPDSPSQVAQFAIYTLFAGAALFTAATGIGLVATGAAVEWVKAGSNVNGAEYAIAAALNSADDGVWFMSIVTIWTGLGFLGLAMRSATAFPRWMGTLLSVLGFGTALIAGLPLAIGVERSGLLLVFAAMAQLTIIWALITGIWMIRNAGPST